MRFVALILSVGLVALGSASLPSGADAAASVPRPRPAEASEFEQATAVIQGTEEVITYDVIDGLAVIEGDIVVGHHHDVQRDGLVHPTADPQPTCPEGQACGVITTNSRRSWPNGVVPYTLAPGTSSRAAQAIQAAITEWENKTSIRFVARTNERDYVEFVGTGNGNSCSSWLGRAGGRQAINYAGTGQGCLVHEIGHAVGLSHEQNRNDRDEHINIDFSNIVPGGESQFRKATGSTDVGQYDFNSVMHYSAYSFARDRSRPVITAKDGRDPRTIGGRNQLTESDVQAVEFVYGDSPPPPSTTTTTEPPTTTTVRPTTTTAPSTTVRPTTTTTPSTSTTGPPSTTATTTPSTTTPSTTAGPPTTTTEPPPSTTATTSAPSSTTTTAPDPGGDRKPVVRFASVQDGQTISRRVPYGGINVIANDPDAGTADGDGIRWVTLVLSEAETGRFLGARREYWSTYDWGLRLRPDRSYTLTAYAVSDWSAGGGWSKTSITVNTGGTTPSTVVVTAPPTTSSPTTAPPTSSPTTAPSSTTTPSTTVPPTTRPPSTTTPSTTTPTTVGDPPDPDAEIRRQVLELTNAERAKAGCPAVTLDPVLNRVADAHTADMAAHGYFSHQGRDGSQPWDRVAAAGYQARGSGENIAQGYSSASEVVAGWMSSPGHRRNILDCDWTELGVGYTNGGRSGSPRVPPIYWAQVFAIPRS